MKKVLQLILAIVIVALVYVVYRQVATPIEFEAEKGRKETAVIERIKDIRAAQRAFKSKYQHFTADFDSLIEFVLNDSLVMERKLVDEDDSVAMAALKAKKIKNVEKFSMAVIDTIFSPKKLTEQDVRNFRFIPGTGSQSEFIMDAGVVTVGNVPVPVMVCKAPYKLFLDTVKYRQELINLVDECKNIYNKYPGIKVGDLEQPNNEAGNWE